MYYALCPVTDVGVVIHQQLSEVSLSALKLIIGIRFFFRRCLFIKGDSIIILVIKDLLL